MKRIAWIDAAKALCILAVVWSHFVNGGAIERLIYCFTGQFLFMLSGYLFKPEHALIPELKKKLRSIMCPYWFYLVLWLPFGLTVMKQPITGFLMDATFWNGMVEWHTPLWFLPTLFSAWLICALLWKFMPGKLPQYIFALGCVALACLMPRRLAFLKTLGITRSLACVPMFLFGYWCREWDLVAKLRKRSALMWAVLILGLAIGMMLNPKITIYRYRFGNYLYTLGGGLAISLGLCALMSMRDAYSPRVSLLANGTVFMMATHMPLALLYRQHVEPIILSMGIWPMTLITGLIAAAIVAVQCVAMIQLHKYPKLAALFGLR